jgi:hypothetical protein
MSVVKHILCLHISRLLIVSQQYVSHIMVITFIGNPFETDSSFFLQDLFLNRERLVSLVG